jgi:thiol-disulfide isomerase/thioredoxin
LRSFPSNTVQKSRVRRAPLSWRPSTEPHLLLLLLLLLLHVLLQWCGPCKLIYPQLVQLSAEFAPAATIAKFNCNQNNKELAKALGIKVRIHA